MKKLTLIASSFATTLSLTQTANAILPDTGYNCWGDVYCWHTSCKQKGAKHARYKECTITWCADYSSFGGTKSCGKSTYK